MTKINLEEEITEDTLFNGKILCRQYKKGYRYSIDSVLVSHFARIKEKERILDLGCGCGIIGLVLLHRYQHDKISVTGIEKQEAFAYLAARNIKDNNFNELFEVICGNVADIREFVEPESFTLIISNPPFYQPARGRSNREQERNEARHQPYEVIDEFVKAASFSVKNRGRAVFIYPAGQITELVSSCLARRLEPKIMRFVYPYPTQKKNANLVLLETMKNGGMGVDISPPLYIYSSRGGDYSEEVERMYR